MHHFNHWIAHYKYVGIFFMQSLGMLGFPMPDESAMMFFGYLVFKGKLFFLPTVAAAFLGNVFGSTTSFWLGRSFGILVLKKYGFRVGITETRLGQVRDWFQRIGKWLLLVGYFIPGVRNTMAYLAGSSKLEFRKFALFAYCGSLVWTTFFIYSGFWLGNSWVRISRQWEHTVLPVVLGMVALGVTGWIGWLIWKNWRVAHS